MNLGLLSLSKWGALCLLFTAALLAVAALLGHRESFPHRCQLAYVTHLDRQLRSLFWPRWAHGIIILQLFLLEAVALGAIWFGQPGLAALALVVLLAPSGGLESLRRRRTRALERDLDGFLLTLANALRASPSLGQALEHSARLLGGPMRRELELALQEIRIGSSVDRALLGLGGRVQSASLDAALLAVLIGRQIGGNLSQVLETTAATLREGLRLRGVLRAKTAEAKAELWILGSIPLFIVLGFNAISPGYFDPLLTSVVGRLLVAVAALFWLGSLLIARHVLAVKS